MPRTVVSTAPTKVQNPTASATLALAATGGTAVDPTNGHEFTQPALPKARKLLIVVDNTFAGNKTVTLKKPEHSDVNRTFSEGPNHRAATADLVLTCPQGVSVFTTELGRWLQPAGADTGSLEGSLFVNYEASMTGDVTFLALPEAI
jgi:hypothetical protein